MGISLDHFLANEWLDLYGPLLTRRQQEVCELYFREDLSYSEIAAELSISKAAVQDCLSKSVHALDRYEKLLHLYSKGQALKKVSTRFPGFEEAYEAEKKKLETKKE